MEILEAVRDIAKSSNYSHCSRRIGKALNALGYPGGRWKARSLMWEAGVQVKHRRKYKVTTHSDHKQPVFENKLNRQLDVEAPNQVYVSDITCIWTRESWLWSLIYFPGKWSAWSMSPRMKARLVCDALRIAI